MKGHWRRILIAVSVIYWLLLLVALHLPGKDLPKTNVSDKFEHFTAYGLLAVFLFACLWPFIRNSLLLGVIVLVVVLGHGALDELTQPWTGRTCDIHDWYADSTGVGIAVIILTTAHALQSARKPNQIA